MPYLIRENQVYKKSGKKMGKSKNPKAYMRALYAAEGRKHGRRKKG